MDQRVKKKATIYDLSVLSGSSPSTVSAVLNGTWRKRRIKESTAQTILGLAELHQYTTNLQARGLRRSRSGLVGLMLPVHDNRYFSSMAQTFEGHVRSRGQCPVVVSASRDPEEERRTAETLISYSIDQLFIVGATDPDGVHEVCEPAGLRHVNIDLPGAKAHSVISDNYGGARMLTEAIIRRFGNDDPLRPDELFLFGGRNDHASRERIAAFHATKKALLGADPEDGVQSSGYSPDITLRAFEAFYQRHGKLPRALFINSSINMEGLLRFMAGRPAEMFSELVVGCYDYDPFGSFLPFPVIMVRQNVEAMITKAFELIDEPTTTPQTFLIAPELIQPRSALKGPLDTLKDRA
ncbi:LacI family DNA-binding transcriptional regulator [Mesorhizobium delmotii]|uniref:Putative transcriptional regulator n=1 Tax=Mesorhizobium delmotii TaxID=1631247 RepID=A0A2P9AFI7_9HYPH|nr:LacI family DNA-binding transcriptional regulator [Mesorhizobium delmotii]SJM29897.1 putative transcriptional regulator [Mesorhizobium delmotii]